MFGRIVPSSVRRFSGPQVALAATALAVALPACGRAQEAQEASDGGRMASALDPLIERAFAFGIAPGMAVAAIQGDEIVYLRSFGFADVEAGRPVTPETVFYIASSTKSFTGLAAAILSERGELDLDASLSRYLPTVQLQEPLNPDEISLRELLTHTHGIGNSGPVTFRSAYSGVFTHDQLVELLAHHPPAPDGREFSYGNIGYNVASLAMDEALGIGWKDVLQREIFGPLGMRSTTGYVSEIARERLAIPYGPEPESFSRQYYAKGDANMHAAGGLVSTARDLTRWLRANLKEGRVGGEQILSATAIAEAQRPQAEQDGTFMSFRRTGYGLGWNTGSYEGDAFTHHFGGFSGFHAHISFMPEKDVGVAVLLNSGVGALLADIVSRYIYDTLNGMPRIEEKYAGELEALGEQVEQGRQAIRADRERRAGRPQELPHPLEAYAGAFESDLLGRIEFEIVDGKLEARMGRLWSEVEVYDNERNMLRVELIGNGEVVPFVFEEGEERASAVMYRRIRFERVE